MSGAHPSCRLRLIGIPLPKTKLTDIFATWVALADGQAELIYSDADVVGFGLRVRPASKTWITAYRAIGAGHSKNTEELRLSTFPSFETGWARRLAREMAGRVAAGESPAAHRAGGVEAWLAGAVAR